MSSELTAAERVNLLEEMQKEDANRRRKAQFVSWVSVGLATLVLTLLVLGAGWQLSKIRAQLKTETAALESIKNETTAAQDQLKKIKAELNETKGTLAANKELLEIAYTAPQGRNAFEQRLADDQKTVKLPPRAYFQIVDSQDRPWANTMRIRLEEAGFIVPGIELVTKAAPTLKSTEVRYYKKADEDGAKRIVELLKAAGVHASLEYLHPESGPTVGPNHFEVWFPTGSRNTK
jgi:hypothetical protein